MRGEILDATERCLNITEELGDLARAHLKVPGAALVGGSAAVISVRQCESTAARRHRPCDALSNQPLGGCERIPRRTSHLRYLKGPHFRLRGREQAPEVEMAVLRPGCNRIP